MGCCGSLQEEKRENNKKEEEKEEEKEGEKEEQEKEEENEEQEEKVEKKEDKKEDKKDDKNDDKSKDKQEEEKEEEKDIKNENEASQDKKMEGEKKKMVASHSQVQLTAKEKDDFLIAVREWRGGPGAEWIRIQEMMKDARFANDKDCMLALVKTNGYTLQFASKDLKKNRDVVKAALVDDRGAVEYADKEASMWGDRDFVLAMVQVNGLALMHANYKTDREIVVAAVKQLGCIVKDDMSLKDLVIAGIKEDAAFLACASDDLRADKDVVLIAVRVSGRMLKYALGSLNQDHDCLKAAGLFDDDETKVYERPEEATLSVRFSLAAVSETYATEFANQMKKDEFLGKFKTYNPNTWCKKSCDPNFTDKNHPCRGSSTCGRQSVNLDPVTQRPCKESCWRFAFRFHQEESKQTNGYMIQVEEIGGLGKGQEIETEMAREVGLKVFRTYTNIKRMDKSFEPISKAVKAWYDSGCANTDLENVFIGVRGASYIERPQYEQL